MENVTVITVPSNNFSVMGSWAYFPGDQSGALFPTHLQIHSFSTPIYSYSHHVHILVRQCWFYYPKLKCWFPSPAMFISTAERDWANLKSYSDPGRRPMSQSMGISQNFLWMLESLKTNFSLTNFKHTNLSFFAVYLQYLTIMYILGT